MIFKSKTRKLYTIMSVIIVLLSSCSTNNEVTNEIPESRKLIYTYHETNELWQTVRDNYPYVDAGSNLSQIHNIIFGSNEDYPNITREYGFAVDQEGSGNIMMYIEDDTVYILSNDIIYIVDTDKKDIFKTNSLGNILDASVFSSSEIYYICLDNIDTTNVTDMSYTFNIDCRFYENILKIEGLENLDTSNVTNMNNMFASINSEYLNLSSFNTSKVTDMSCMFGGNNLLKLDLSSFDTHNVITMESMFAGYKGDYLDLSSFDTSNVLDMECMFFQSSLKEINLSSFDTRKVKKMNSMFFGCHNLHHIDISSFYIDENTEIEEMFWDDDIKIVVNKENCKIDISKNTTRCKCIILENDNNSENNIVATDPFLNITTYKDVLKNNNISVYKISGVVFGKKSDYDFSETSGIPVDNQNSGAIRVYYKDQILYILADDKVYITDSSRMFEGFRGLKTIDFTNIDTSYATDMSYMFSDCYSLEELDLSLFNTKNVRNMSNMFEKCGALKSLDLSNFDTSNVTDMSYMFKLCKGIKQLDLSCFNTSNVTNMKGMFCACYELENIDLSSFDTKKVTNMKQMFGDYDESATISMNQPAGCRSLKILDLSSFDTSNVTDMSRMFYECVSLEEINVSSFSTSNVESVDHMFYKCDSLSELDISNFDFSNLYTGCCLKLSFCDNLQHIYVNKDFEKNYTCDDDKKVLEYIIR